MERSIFQIVPVKKPSFLQRLFKQHPPENAVIELNNLLASNDLLALNQNILQQIEQKYNFPLTDFELNLQEFYAVYWNQYLKDNTAASIEKTDKLATLLGLPATIVEMLQIKIGKVWYEHAASDYLSLGQFLVEDERKLDLFRKKLKLPQAQANEVLSDVKHKIFQRSLDKVVKRGRCTPTEEQTLITMANNFGINDSTVNAGLQQLKTLKYYWELDNLPLKTFDGDGAIQKSELCYFKMRNVQWIEVRGSGSNKRYEQVNYGSLYLTNKRLVFEGNSKNSVITYDKILRISKSGNGVMIHKDKGKDPVLSFNDDYTVFELIIQRLLRGVN
ncbi:hypothetical protein [Mucilaginibacter sp. NFX135]|uniref:hypothetical protein n=1 Tax=Mucilaginibacter sp. NFX135 TaxID=3402687 RepID=UPI003AFA5272